MDRFEHSFIVDRPVEAVYAQWSRFDKFSGLVVDNVPHRRIAWRSDGAPAHRGKVEFEPHGATRTVVKVEMEFEHRPDTVGENAASAKEMMAALAGELGVLPAAESTGKAAR